ncbi:hypothetical protein K788_0002309 [Paraburkholderia caribensis MBA4]|uniref:Uncharacterized protein n=1 Tax=Paraburkholderia caribensis MBA4 TaxID=1323664 RepID=A0A0P0R9Z4_9BURK|nr:hypothetical protein K788_0002309 [Paraburkholderia caribensis MBA4]
MARGPAGVGRAQARDGLLDAARDSGVHSGAYRAARQRLIAAM